jgi:glycerol kinase
MKASYILSIDQGTSSTKTIIFDDKLQVISRASVPLNAHYAAGGFVEQDPEDIYQTVISSVDQCVLDFTAKGYDISMLKTCGITNQRETMLVWDDKGNPLYNAVVWQCKRSIDICNRMEKEGMGKMICAKTGLLIDPYFSGSKMIWLYENVAKVREALDAGKAYFGTVDTWLLYQLSGGSAYLTDYTNASRTLFFNIHTLSWDQELLEVFGLSGLNLPEARPSANFFGTSHFEGIFPQKINIEAMIGDSHAAAVGEGCFTPGTAKATMGTGCSILMNVGETVKESALGMVSTICWSMEGRVDYALEGVIVSCGAIIEWMKNQLELFPESKETEALARTISDNGGVYLIPAFSGLGAPYWQMDRKASIHGLTFDSTKNHLVRAALESIAFQVRDIIAGMEQDTGITLERLMVNGGLTTNRFLLQLTADLLGKALDIKGIPDITAQGAGILAGLQAKIFPDLDHLQALLQNQSEILPNPRNAQIQQDYIFWRSIILKGNEAP